MKLKLKKIGFLLILLLVALNNSIAQSIYNSSNYAVVGDAFYLTNASNLGLDYSTTGANLNWNFTTLTGISQSELQFKNPNTPGYPSCPYVYNSKNTNLASTNETSTSLNIGGQTLGIQDYNDYYKKSDGDLTQVASAYKLNINGILIPVANKFTEPDIIYTFPIKFGNTETNNSEYKINIPGIYYQSKTVVRTNDVDGWGSVTTPFGNFSNVLRMKTTLVENDSISITGVGLPKVIRTSRELKWFDTTRKYPVLIVTQSFAANIWTTTKVEYLDAKKDFQTTALFAYTPILPTAGATVYFQNLSTNATKYTWDFDDPDSLAANSSTEQNPTHIYNKNGTYNVTLTSSNDSFTKSITLPVVVSDDTVALFAYTPVLPIVGETVNFQNLSLNGDSYLWDFDDSASGTANSSTEKNPSHIFNTKGTYLVKLTSTNSTSTKSITLPVVVSEENLGLETNFKSEKINIFPNPFSNSISILEDNNKLEYELSNLEGKTVYKANHIQNDFSNLSKGIYLLKVTDSNNKTAIFKLVKK